jgi:hypothetical protein
MVTVELVPAATDAGLKATVGACSVAHAGGAARTESASRKIRSGRMDARITTLA